MPCSTRGRVVRANFAADAVLERRDDFAARRVIFRVGGEHQHQVERQPHRIALNLHVAFLHDVEQAHLDLAGQVGQFVDGEDAAVGARQQAVVDGQLVGNIVAAARRLDGIDIADHVGDGHVGRGQLFHVAVLARPATRWACRRPAPRSGRGSGGRSAGTDCRGSRSPSTYGVDSSSSVVSMRISRVLACPRSPSRMKLWRERMALTICGTTVSS